MPPPVPFDAATPSPVQPQPENELERFEGMLVEVINGVATGPSDAFGDVAVVARPQRAFREAGIAHPGVAGLPVWDGNPEVFEVTPAALGLPELAVPAGAVVVRVEGPQ